MYESYKNATLINMKVFHYKYTILNKSIADVDP